MDMFRDTFGLFHAPSSNRGPNVWGFRVFSPESRKSSLLEISRSALRYLEIAPFDTATNYQSAALPRDSEELIPLPPSSLKLRAFA